MKLDRQYLGALDIAPKPQASGIRTSLLHVLIERLPSDDLLAPAGRLVVANGFILAVVPVNLEHDDLPGLVSAASLREAFKADKGSDPVRAHVHEEAVVARNGASYPRYTDGVTADSQYPGFKRITPNGVAGALGLMATRPLIVNPLYLAQLGKALGGQGVMVWPNPEGYTSPLVVTPVADGRRIDPFDEDGWPRLPYGVQMPMHAELPVGLLPPAALPAEPDDQDEEAA